MKLGLEVEYWVIDETGRLCSGQDLLGIHDAIVPEFIAPLIEIQIAPYNDVAAIRRDLKQTLELLLEEGGALGKRLVPLGTPLMAGSVLATTERGQLLERVYGDRLDYAKHCAGTHVHFDKHQVTRQLNLLTALDPALALVNSSPYYRGEPMASSSRAHVYRGKSDHDLAFYRDLWGYTSSADEWTQRIDRRYRAFRTLATDRGVSDEAFTEWFQPENAVLTPVRLRRRSPTVEWRAPDTALPSQILQLVADVARLLHQSEHKPVEIGEPGVLPDRIHIPEFTELRRLEYEAISYGLNSTAVRDYLETMGFDTAQYQPLAARLPARRRLGEQEARQLRLAAADQLQADVDALETTRQTVSHPATTTWNPEHTDLQSEVQ